MQIADTKTAIPVERAVSENLAMEFPHASLGSAMEVGADCLVGIRGLGAIGIYTYIERTPDYQSWKLAAAFGALALTDLVDGALARFGRKLQGKDESVRRPWKAYPDHLADKGLVNGTTLAIAKREWNNGNHAYASVVGASAGIFIVRDVVTTGERIAADLENIDTRAKKSGKIKALKQYVTIGVALSPLSKNPASKLILGGAFTYTAKESVTSGIDIHNDLSAKRTARQNRAKAA